jgi:hypothetical protein
VIQSFLENDHFELWEITEWQLCASVEGVTCKLTAQLYISAWPVTAHCCKCQHLKLSWWQPQNIYVICPSKLWYRHLINIHLSLELKQHLSKHSIPQQLISLRLITWQSKQTSSCLIRFVVLNTGHFDCLAAITGMLADVGPKSISHDHFLEHTGSCLEWRAC